MRDQLWNSFFALDPQTRAALIAVAGSLIAAFVAVIGTILSVGAALFGIYFNLKWNRSKHRSDQLLSLRRDVYVSAHESIIAAALYLVRLTEEGTDIHEGEKVSERFGGVAAKIQLLGTEKTSLAMLAMQRQFVQSNLELLREKQQLQGNSLKLELVQKHLESLAQLEAQQHDQRSHWRARHETGEISVEEMTAKEREIDTRLATIPHVREKAAEIKRVAFELQKGALHLAAIAAQKLAPLSMDLTLCLRSELGLGGNDLGYQREMYRFLEDGMNWLNNHIEEIDKIHAATVADIDLLTGTRNLLAAQVSGVATRGDLPEPK